MTWQRRLRDLLLAGGTLAMVACSSENGDGSASNGGAGGTGGSGGTSGRGGVPCCNANYDPCCRFEYCGEPMSPACACKLDGGAYDPTFDTCGPGDAGTDGGGDASVDASDAAADQ